MSLRSSGAPRWVPCSGSVHLEPRFPEPLHDEDAREGTAAHWLGAQVLGGHYEIEELTDRPAPNGVICTGEMVDHVQLYIDTVRQVTATPVIEQTLPRWNTLIEPGTPDARCVTGGVHGVIWDLKYGYGIVEPSSWQLADYAVSFWLKHPDIETITVVIVQPRPFHPAGRVRQITYDRHTLLDLYNRLCKAANDANNPIEQTQCVTGDHCKDCRALHGCEAARRAGLNAVDVSLRTAQTDIGGAALSEELRVLERAKKMITARLDAMQSHAMSEIDSNRPVPGWSIGRGFGKRQWKDDNAAATVGMLSGKTLTETKPISPAAAERAGVSKELVKQFTTQPETGRKLIPVDGQEIANKVFNT